MEDYVSALEDAVMILLITVYNFDSEEALKALEEKCQGILEDILEEYDCDVSASTVAKRIATEYDEE